jgi:predicted RNase H-like nuclease
MSEPNERDEKLLEDLEGHCPTARRAIVAAYREEIEQGLSDRITQRDQFRRERDAAHDRSLEAARVAREAIEANVALSDQNAALKAEVERLKVAWNAARVSLSDVQAEVERLRSLDNKTSCPDIERAGWEGLVAALTAECNELKSEVEQWKAKWANVVHERDLEGR